MDLLELSLEYRQLSERERLLKKRIAEDELELDNIKKRKSMLDAKEEFVESNTTNHEVLELERYIQLEGSEYLLLNPDKLKLLLEKLRDRVIAYRNDLLNNDLILAESGSQVVVVTVKRDGSLRGYQTKVRLRFDENTSSRIFDLLLSELDRVREVEPVKVNRKLMTIDSRLQEVENAEIEIAKEFLPLFVALPFEKIINHKHGKLIYSNLKYNLTQ